MPTLTILQRRTEEFWAFGGQYYTPRADAARTATTGIIARSAAIDRRAGPYFLYRRRYRCLRYGRRHEDSKHGAGVRYSCTYRYGIKRGDHIRGVFVLTMKHSKKRRVMRRRRARAERTKQERRNIFYIDGKPAGRVTKIAYVGTETGRLK